jgi:hypothetical protein
MANFEGYSPHTVDKFSSLFEQDDPTNAPLGVAAVCRNCRFELTSVRTRDGVNQRVGNGWFGLNMGTNFPVTGAYSFKYEGNGVVPDKVVPVVFDQNGNLKVESPPGSGVLVAVTSANVVPGALNYLQATQTQNRAYMAFTNLANPAVAASVNAVYDLNTGVLDPLSMRPVGEQFKTAEPYRVGECVTPILPTAGGNGFAAGRLFRCTTAGTSGNVEPVWPNVDGGVIATGGATFTENTPVFSTVLNTFNGLISNVGSLTANEQQPNMGIVATGSVNAASGGFAAGRDIYVCLTLVNGNGETLTLSGLAVRNTALNDQLKIKITTALRPWILALTGLAAVTGWNLYVADVATGALPPASLAFYGKVPGGPFSIALNTQVLVNASPGASGTYTSTISEGIGDVSGDIIPTVGVGQPVTLPNGRTFVQGPSGLLPIATGGSGVPVNDTAFLVAAPGNIPSGTRYAVVLFVNRNDYISGYGAGFFIQGSVLTGGLQIFMANIPLGPPETKQRIIAFSQSGGTQVGPFAYIPTNDTQNGIPITATVINDNTTTTASFNFTDTYLEDEMATTANVTNFFDKLKVPACRSVTYLETLDRMAYLAYQLPSGFFLSPPRDPETIFSSTGGVEVSETDRQNLMGILDYKGVNFCVKEASGHELNPSQGDPSDWTTTRRWEGMGACGLRAFATGTFFFGFVHRSGVYVNFGDVPERIIKEIPVTWARVNWNAAATIWMFIDQTNHDIYIGVPLDFSTVPSHVLVCNWEEDRTLGPPIHTSAYSRGKFVSTAAARKWSVYDIAANSCTRTERKVTNPPFGFDTATVTSQLWFASSVDSGINAQTPGIYSDNGGAIPWVYETVCPGDALKVSQLGGVQALLTGQGAIGITVLAGSTRSTQDGGVNTILTEIALAKAIVSPGTTTDYSCGANGMNERYRVRFSNIGQAPGTWGKIMSCTIFTRPIYQARPN